MPYFQHLEPDFDKNISEEHLLEAAAKEPYSAINYLSLYESAAGEKYSNPLTVRSSQVVNKSTLHTSLNSGLVGDDLKHTLYVETEVMNLNQIKQEDSLTDWIEGSVSQADVDKIIAYEYEPQTVLDVRREPEEDEEIINSENNFVVLNSLQENPDNLKQEKIRKKLKKKDLKFIAQPDANISDFNNWLVQFKPIKGGNLHKLAKIEKKINSKSSVVLSAEKSVKKTNQMVSEPLAKLLANQGHNEQAIEMYNRLILKFPEKSAYFAAQIEKLNNKG